MKRCCIIACCVLWAGTVTLAQSATPSATLHVYRNAQLITDPNAYASMGKVVAKGRNIVFEYTYNNGGDQTVDLQSIEKVVWQVKRCTRNFRLEGASLQKHEMSYAQLCRCVDGGWQAVDSGYVEGHRKGNIWTINLKVHPQGHRSKNRYHIDLETDGKEQMFVPSANQ